MTAPLLENDNVWIDASPFRAHVRWLTDGGIEHPLIACAANVPASLVDRLVQGRSGRPRPRILRPFGARLLALTVEDFHVRGRFTEAPDLACALLTRLRGLGLGWDSLARSAQVGERDVRRWYRGTGSCPSIARWRLQALSRECGLPSDLDDIEFAAAARVAA